MKALSLPENMHCANCGTPVQGAYCHACGQAVHSALRPLHSMLEDTLDLLFDLDGRVLHTLPPLFVRPGFLTLEYFSGRRARYVAPFRLMFVFCLMALFVTHFAFGDMDMDIDMGPTHVVTVQSFRQAKSPAEVKLALQQQLRALDSIEQHGIPAKGSRALEKAKRQLRHQANLRLQQLGVSAVAAAAVDEHPPPAASTAAAPAHSEPESFGDIMDPARHPSQIPWLPGFANQRLTQMRAHLAENLKDLSGNDTAKRREAFERIEAGGFAVLPQTLFVLIPLFALLLKVVYLFRRRLYMEHLTVALHSHAFLFLCLLLGVSLHLLSSWLSPHAAWVAPPLRWLQIGLAVWAPVYLLLMQKRVYRQGWFMTVLKYLFLGWCYTWLFGLALGAAVLLGMAN